MLIAFLQSYTSRKPKEISLLYLLFIFSFGAAFMNAQTVTISGFLKESEGTSLPFANVVYDSNADQLLKVEVTDENGVFAFRDMAQRGYQLKGSFVGLSDIIRSIDGLNEEVVDLGLLQFGSTGIELQEAVLTASRAIVEVKPDRTVFNVDGKINNVGSEYPYE